MVMTDLQVKESMLKLLTASDRELLDMIVQKHLRNAPHNRMRMAIWLNANESPWVSGVTLLEICENIAIDPNPDFRGVEFGPRSGWPRLRVIMTHRTELNVDYEMANIASEMPFIEDVKRSLKDGSAKIVYPVEANVFDLENILAEPWNLRA